MFYKALGFAVWKLGLAYLRRRYGRQVRIAAVLTIASIAVAGYLGTRSSSS
jgi:heme A synthase